MSDNKTFDEIAAEITIAWIRSAADSAYVRRLQFLDDVKKFYDGVFKQITESHDEYYNR